MVPDEVPVGKFCIFRVVAFDIAKRGWDLFIAAEGDLLDKLAHQIPALDLVGVTRREGHPSFVVDLA